MATAQPDDEPGSAPVLGLLLNPANCAGRWFSGEFKASSSRRKSAASDEIGADNG